MLEEYRYCGKEESLEVQLIFFPNCNTVSSLWYWRRKEKMHHRELLDGSSVLFSAIFPKHIPLVLFSLYPGGSSSLVFQPHISAIKSILIMVNRGFNILWKIIINENRRFCSTMTLCYKKHIFDNFCETGNDSNWTWGSFQKSESFILTFLCGLLFMILLLCNLLCYWWYFLTMLFWEK